MTTFLPHPVPKHLSYSQATTLADCGERYRLERIFRVPTPPSWAAVGGKAMHLASEWIDRLDVSETNFVQWLTWQYLPMVDSSQTESPGPDQSGIARAAALKVDETHAVTKSALEDGLRAVKDLGLAGPEWSLENVPDSVSALWRHAFSEEIQNEVRHADTQYQDTSTWKVFGRATKFWPDKENRAWWDHHGPVFLIRWINFRATSGWDLILLDDDPEQPAIEIDCSGLIGDVALKGFIDRLFLDERGQPFILDLKSTGKLPTERKQLGVYRVLLGKLGFPMPAKGVYWWSRNGMLGPPLTISDFNEPELAWEFSGLQDLRNSGFLRPNTKSITCSYCGVKPYCRAQDGDLAHLIPKPWESPRPEIKSN